MSDATTGELGACCDVDDVVARIVELRGPTSTGTLHRLLYFAQGWHLAWEGVPLFAAPLVAWASGPVVADVFAQHRGVYRIDTWPAGDAAAVQGASAATVAEVVGSYGLLDSDVLHDLARSDRPWVGARRGLGPAERGGEVIDLDDLAEFYAALDLDESAVPVAQFASAGSHA
jgi:uncharacterized phage-associated protein